MGKIKINCAGLVFDTCKVNELIKKVDDLLKNYHDLIDVDSLYNIKDKIVTNKCYDSKMEFYVEDILSKVEDAKDPNSFFNIIEGNSDGN